MADVMLFPKLNCMFLRPFFTKLGTRRKSYAYLIYSEWGPNLQVPRERRLADKFPRLPEENRKRWLEEFKRVDGAIWKAAEEGVELNDVTGEFSRHFAKLFPWMSAKALERARFLASYYAWREGYVGKA